MLILRNNGPLVKPPPREAARLARGQSCREIQNLPAVTIRFKLERARRSAPWFEKLCRDVLDLLT